MSAGRPIDEVNCGRIGTGLISMRVLLLIAHGDYDGKSNSHLLAHSADEALKAAGNETRLVDLVKSGFNVASSKSDFLVEVASERFSSLLAGASRDSLKPEIREQQDNINWATHVIVFGPVWYHGLPSCFYAYYPRGRVEYFALSLQD
jgi:putative NADPH-quinone reductase